MTKKLGKQGTVTMQYTAVYADGEGWSTVPTNAQAIKTLEAKRKRLQQRIADIDAAIRKLKRQR